MDLCARVLGCMLIDRFHRRAAAKLRLESKAISAQN